MGENRIFSEKVKGSGLEITYICICFSGEVVLAEFSGNFNSIALQCLQKLPSPHHYQQVHLYLRCPHLQLPRRQRLQAGPELFGARSDLVLDRGEKIELLLDKTENLHHQAQDFRSTGTKMQRKMWVQNMRIKLIVLGTLIPLILVIFLNVCGGFNCGK